MLHSMFFFVLLGPGATTPTPGQTLAETVTAMPVAWEQIAQGVWEKQGERGRLRFYSGYDAYAALLDSLEQRSEMLEKAKRDYDLGEDLDDALAKLQARQRRLQTLLQHEDLPVIDPADADFHAAAAKLILIAEAKPLSGSGEINYDNTCAGLSEISITLEGRFLPMRFTTGRNPSGTKSLSRSDAYCGLGCMTTVELYAELCNGFQQMGIIDWTETNPECKTPAPYEVRVGSSPARRDRTHTTFYFQALPLGGCGMYTYLWQVEYLDTEVTQNRNLATVRMPNGRRTNLHLTVTDEAGIQTRKVVVLDSRGGPVEF